MSDYQKQKLEPFLEIWARHMADDFSELRELLYPSHAVGTYDHLTGLSITKQKVIRGQCLRGSRARWTTEVGWKKWSPTDRVIYDLEDENGTTTEGVVLAGVSSGSGQTGRADGDVYRAGGEAVVDT